MLTVREAMKTGGLSKCRLLAGEAGLDNAITCVDCMEVPNIEPWLRSGELLITTGYALRDDENAIPYLLETLTKGKAAALAIKTRFLGELKDTDIALAQRLGLPLFEMPSDMPTTEMVMPVVRMLTNRQVEIMEFSEKIHKRFTEIELSDGGFRKIAAVLSKLLQMPRPSSMAQGRSWLPAIYQTTSRTSRITSSRRCWDRAVRRSAVPGRPEDTPCSAGR